MGSRRKAAGNREEAVAVAIDNDKGSHYAIKWAVNHLLTRGQALTLLHVKQTTSPLPNQSKVAEVDAKVYKNQVRPQAREMFLPFRGFCTRKNIKCSEVIVEDTDIPRGLISYATDNSIEILVLGAPSRNGFFSRFKTRDVPGSVSKGAPDFCTVYVINKEKISYTRSATVALRKKFLAPTKVSEQIDTGFVSKEQLQEWTQYSPHRRSHHVKLTPPLTKARPTLSRSYEPRQDCDIMSVSSGRPSVDRSSVASGMTSQCSINSEIDCRSSTSSYYASKYIDSRSTSPSYLSVQNGFSSCSIESGNSWTSQNMDAVEAEMRKLKLELNETMEMYHMACKDALTETHKVKEINRWKLEEEHRLEKAKLAEEVALALIEKEKEKCKAAIEAAEVSQRIAESEAQKRRILEMKSLQEAEESNKALKAKAYGLRYRKYTIEEIEAATNDFSKAQKIGVGGYGPVYRGELDYTPVAIKALRPDAVQGHSQFQQEVKILSLIRHPNMVLLVGACPEYGCLVYEYMSNGSLEDRLFRHGNTPVLPWQLRFRIAAEIATGLLFLHQTKPEPLVHRDLKPANILLDQNFTSKISDVGLARLIPPSYDAVTKFHMTSAAGTFCYIDPEYQRTGMLGIKSDVYSLGVVLLQIITARPPMGLSHHIGQAIETGTFAKILDPAVLDWPVEEALKFAKLALQCAEMRRRDRPDLGKVVLPELNRLRAFAEASTNCFMLGGGGVFSPIQDVMTDPYLPQSGYNSSRSQSSTSSCAGTLCSDLDVGD